MFAFFRKISCKPYLRYIDCQHISTIFNTIISTAFVTNIEEQKLPANHMNARLKFPHTRKCKNVQKTSIRFTIKYMGFMTGYLLPCTYANLSRKKKMQNLACQWVFAFGKLEIFVHYFFTNSEHTIFRKCRELSQLSTCIYPFDDWKKLEFGFAGQTVENLKNAIGCITWRNCWLMSLRLCMCTLQPQEKSVSMKQFC